MSKKLIPVKLTESQWAHVTECVSEWGSLVCGEAELMNGDVIKSNYRRGLMLQDLAVKIDVKVAKQRTSNEST